MLSLSDLQDFTVRMAKRIGNLPLRHYSQLPDLKIVNHNFAA